MDRHVTVVLCCAFLYLLLVAAIETIAIIYKDSSGIDKNEKDPLKVVEGLNHSKFHEKWI